MAATAVHVFGKPITHGTRAQRALAAKNNENADGKLDQALLFLNQSQKAAAGGPNRGTVNITHGRIYNRSGDTVTYVDERNWEGHVVGRFPVNIQNGQWAVFVHAAIPKGGSVAAVVYNIDSDSSDSVISWNNPWNGNNTAYCEMNDPGYFNKVYLDTVVRPKLLASGTKSNSTCKGYATTVSIDEEGNTPCYKAIFHLDV